MGVAVSDSFVATMTAAVPIGVGFSLAIPVLNAALQAAAPEDLRGRVMAAFAMAHLGVRPAFALVAGATAAAVGPRLSVLLFALLAVAGLALMASGITPLRRRSTAPMEEK